MNKIYNAIIGTNIIFSSLCFAGVIFYIWLFIHFSDYIRPDKPKWYDIVSHYCVNSPNPSIYSTEASSPYRVIIQYKSSYIENHFNTDEYRDDYLENINESRYFIEYKGKRYPAFINANFIEQGYVSYIANVGNEQNAQTIIFKEFYEKNGPYYHVCYVHLSQDKNENIDKDKGKLKISFTDY